MLGSRPGEEVRCDSRDCGVFYSRGRAKGRARRAEEGIEGVVGALERTVESEMRLEW